MKRISSLKNLFYKPRHTQLTVTSGNGFHLRPVAQFSALSKSFSCAITATFRDKTVDTKSVNTLLSLSLEQGDTFTLTTQGKQAEKALEALQALFASLMRHDKVQQPLASTSHSYQGTLAEVQSIFGGIAIGPVHHYHVAQTQHQSTLSFEEALTHSIDELETLFASHKEEENASIYLAQKELLLSVSKGCQSLTELEQRIDESSKKLLGTVLDSKRSDYQDILLRTKKHLGLDTKAVFPETPFVLLCNDLLPSEVSALSHTKVLGVILKETSLHSHTAILLRAAGLCTAVLENVVCIPKETIILDTHAGVLVYKPTPQDISTAKQLQHQDQNTKTQSAQKRFERAHTREGKCIDVYANVSDTASAHLAKEEGAQGIGLLRSEFLFTALKPSFEEQQAAYKEIFDLFDEITVRTIDVGGDKSLPYIQIAREANPFLGVRGVRLFHTHPELLEEQLHAIFVAAGSKSVRIMFPMVSTVEEFVYAKAFAYTVATKYALDISHLQFGIMIEVPSVLFLMKAFNTVVDFYSIGTNDLTQYLFATERTHPSLKVDECSPVVFDAIQTVVDHATKPVSICGELATYKNAIPALIHLGITALSVSPKSIAQTKAEIRDV